MTGSTGRLAQDLAGARIAVLMGGQSSERSISLKTGQAVTRALETFSCQVVAIDFGPDGVRQLMDADPQVVVLALHGGLGENGAVQGLLECLGIPYTGSGVLASALAMDKVQSKRLFEARGVPTPAWWVAEPGCPAPEAGYPWVVKPSLEGSSVGVAMVPTAEDWERALDVSAAGAGAPLVERAVVGRELTVAIFGHHVLGTVEVKPESGFYDFDAKYARGDTRYLCPAPLDEAQATAVEEAALGAWRALGCRGTGRVDVMLGDAGDGVERPWVLEVNTVPGLTGTSLVPRVAAEAGWTFEELVRRMVLAACTDEEVRRGG